jgi:hypothetical protein
MSNVPFKEAKKKMKMKMKKKKIKTEICPKKKTLSRMAIRVYYGKEENTHI